MLSDYDKLLLKTGAEELSVTLNSLAIERLELVAERLYEANQHINLTRVPVEKTVTLHFLDSLTLGCAVSIHTGSRMLDVGAGAGFPGLPLAIAYPTVHMTLLDSTQKRLAFLDSLIKELGIDNVRLVHGRAENLGSTDLNRAFDIVTARAVANMNRLAGWLIPFVALGGFAVAYKSNSAREEIESSRNTIQLLGGRLDRIKEVNLPRTNITRLLAIISINNKMSQPDKHEPCALRTLQHTGKHKEKH